MGAKTEPGRWRGRLWRLAVGVAVVGLVAACSSAAAPALSNFSKGGDGQQELSGGAATAAPAMPSAAAALGGAPADQSVGSGTTGGNGGGTGTSIAFQDNAAIVKTGTLSVEVPEIDPALVKARSIIVGAGGYVSASQEARQTDNPVASVTYRIPAASWDDTLDKLRALGKPLAENTNAVEVTGQLIDLQARITNLRATESALQAIMAKATKISDILDVQQQLTDIRGQIEELSGQQAHLQDQASYGTLTVTWTIPAPPAVAVTSDKWDPGKEVDQAVASLLDGAQALATVGIWLGIVGLPLLVAVALLVAIAVFVLRRLGAGRPVRTVQSPPAPGAQTPA